MVREEIADVNRVIHLLTVQLMNVIVYHNQRVIIHWIVDVTVTVVVVVDVIIHRIVDVTVTVTVVEAMDVTVIAVEDVRKREAEVAAVITAGTLKTTIAVMKTGVVTVTAVMNLAVAVTLRLVTIQQIARCVVMTSCGIQERARIYRHKMKDRKDTKVQCIMRDQEER